MREIIKAYFKEIDQSIEKLSNRFEGNLTSIPSWILCYRKIRVGYIDGSNFVLISITPSDDLMEDEVIEEVISTNEELRNFHSPWVIDNIRINNLPQSDFYQAFGDMKMIEKNNINALPVLQDKALRINVTKDLIPVFFSLEEARQNAIDFWNNGQNEFSEQNSFVDNLQNIFDRFKNIIKRKSFVERRIHRYINEYYMYLLPSHIDKYFEHPLYLNGEKRVADFILKRENSLPSMLIELESPNVKIFKKNGEPTAEANHAKNQISEWVRFIEQNSKNAEGEFEFLHGPKERLVIMGRGMDYKEQMMNSRYTDTLMWTYDFLIIEAKEKWNKFILEQCKVLGIEHPNLIQ
ncbi:TPA: DUF4263 domain-containing protein [Bacillus cereus]|uniref:Shedu anti-phage system protein SduA domain-containing protein n=1 Tax=Bacillus cereus group TaxID=86661 RepID=UPI000BEB899E|nr:MULTISPECIES: Shedu anti-phage system protein SduA domain-containing protein [Bacillus cereus group]PDZ54984.1 hypothetical protein CON15_23975 [Bacillus cereus]PFF61853.1 hypothetical protein CN358_17060 [Bacillus thuringiensis]PFI60630.1 hypothetical protein COI70_07760 [Bacillus cereus]PGR39872.1 hypothetical protein COC47_09635 [Bacillus cereus]PGY23277.1 hypothetical protein COE27_28765 [Bacillus cereus]